MKLLYVLRLLALLALPLGSLAQFIPLQNLNPQGGEPMTETRFGYDVAVDGPVMVVGAAFENGLAGAAYVYERVNGAWQQTARLVTSDQPFYGGGQFGQGVAVSGGTVVVGAIEQDADATRVYTGAVYVFEKIAGAWTQVQRMVVEDGATGDFFGASVALSGNTLVVGAIRANDFDGAAYVFEKIAGTWTQTQKLLPSDETSLFGRSVGVSSGTVVVGVSGQSTDAEGNNPLSGAGAAYVFEKVGGTWTQTQKLVANDRANQSSFGNMVAISGGTVVVAASNQRFDGSGNQELEAAGAAYVFQYTDGAWGLPQKLVADDRAAGGRFGRDVGVSGGTVVVGATREVRDETNNLLYDVGTAYVFCQTAFSSVPTVSLTPACAGASIRLSFSSQTTRCAFPPGTAFAAELSDAVGSFASPVNLGPISPGINTLTLPQNTPSGSGYWVRIAASGAYSSSSAAFRVNQPSFSSTPTVSTDNKCAGEAVRLSFAVGSCAFPAGNVFRAELSSAAGSFAAPLNLGPVSAGALNNVVIPAGTPAGTGYKLRVLSSNPEVFSAGSANFRVKACGNTREIAPDESGLRVVVSPNPAPEGRLRIALSGAEGQALRLELFNAIGQSVGELRLPQTGAEDVFDWDISRQPAGLYLLRVSGKKEARTVKVLH